MDNPYQISGQIPFDAGSGALGSALGGGVGAAYTSAYNAALSQNQAQYGNILQGYQQTAGNQFNTQQGIQGGYGSLQNGITTNLGTQLNNAGASQAQGQNNIQQGYGQLAGNVQGTIQGITASQQQAINDAYTQQSGSASQSLINRGLGNTTIQGTMQRGLQLDQQKASIALANQQAQLSAGYQSQLGLAGLGYAGQSVQANTQQSNLSAEQQAAYGSQLGLAGLGYQNQANMQNTQQANNQLGFMNSVQMQYPNAQAYGQLLYNQGALGLAQQGQQNAMALANRGLVQGSPAPPIGGRVNTQSGLAQGGYGQPNYGGGQQSMGGYGMRVPAGMGAGGQQMGANGYPGPGNPQQQAGNYPGPGNPQLGATGYPDSYGPTQQGANPQMQATGYPSPGYGYDQSGNFTGGGTDIITNDYQSGGDYYGPDLAPSYGDY